MAAGAVIGLLACLTAVGAVNEDPATPTPTAPPLLAPAQLPPLDVPLPPPEPAGVIAAPTSGPQPVLAVPGLPVPTPPPDPKAEAVPDTGPIGGDGPPPLVAPAASPSPPTDPGGFPPLDLPPSPGGVGLNRRAAVTFDAVPPPLISDPPDPLGAAGRPRMVAPPSSPLSVPIPPASAANDGSISLDGRKSGTFPPAAPAPADPPRRRLFGWIPLPWGPPKAESLPPEDPIRVEPRLDPAADAALQRRVESQIREAVGGQLRALDVRVHGREVTVAARVQRFWNRRSVKRSIEALPALAGTRANIDVTE
jgi:hypothetical protein